MEENRLMQSQSSPPGSLTQNFFIVLPSNGAVTDVVAGAQAETVMRAIQSALVAAPAPQGRSTEKRATLEDVAREPCHRMEI
jgi:L-aminopeptidase/D-esterase-like protein